MLASELSLWLILLYKSETKSLINTKMCSFYFCSTNRAAILDFEISVPDQMERRINSPCVRVNLRDLCLFFSSCCIFAFPSTLWRPPEEDLVLIFPAEWFESSVNVPWLFKALRHSGYTGFFLNLKKLLLIFFLRNFFFCAVRISFIEKWQVVGSILIKLSFNDT